MTRGTKCYILLLYLHTTFLMITGLVMSYLKFAKIFLGFDPPFTPLNTALINHMAGVQNVTTPRAWSADLHN